MRMLMVLIMGTATGCFVIADPACAPGRVVSATGVAGIHDGDLCTVGVLPEGKSWYPCRVTITCANQTLYGGPRLGGYTYCEADRRRIMHAWDDKYAWHDGDPWLELDAQAGRAVIRNQRPDNEVVVEFEPLWAAGDVGVPVAPAQ